MTHSYSVGAPRDRHAELVASLKMFADMTRHNDRKFLQRLAWFLGDRGEQEAAEAIMQHAREPVAYSAYMYGNIGSEGK